MALNFCECGALDREAEMLVILMHGYGSNGRDLLRVARYWNEKYVPTAHIVCPDGPYECESHPGGPGRQWFSLREENNEFFVKEAEGVSPIVIDFIETQLKRVGLPQKRVVLSGFSQGAMLSMYIGLYGAMDVLGVVEYSGWLSCPLNAAIKHKPNMLLLHGDGDNVVLPAACVESAQFLKSSGVSAGCSMEHGAGHEITLRGMDMGGEFIKKLLQGTEKN